MHSEKHQGPGRDDQFAHHSYLRGNSPTLFAVTGHTYFEDNPARTLVPEFEHESRHCGVMLA